MRPPMKSDLPSGIYPKLERCLNFLTKRALARNAMLWTLGFAAIGSATVLAQDNRFVLERDGRTIVLEPYAPNILRVTLSRYAATAAGAAGNGLVGTPSMTGWAHELDAGGEDVFRPNTPVVRVSGDHLPQSLLPQPMPPDDLNQALRDHYFGGGNDHRPFDDTVSVATASGKAL